MSKLDSPRRTAGATRYALLILVVLLAGAGGVIAWLLHANRDVPAPAETAAADSGEIHREGAPGGVADLLKRARASVAQQRLLAPAGDNAVEWYLRVLKQEPANRVAQDALRELFPFAANAAEQTIGQGNAAEAQREIDLLTRADPTNYTLTILRAKLQAQAQVAEDQRRKEEQLAQAAAQKAQARPAAPPVAAAPAPVVANHAPPPAAHPAAAAPVETPAPHPAAPAAVAASTSPVLKRRVEPYYPDDARRTRRQGWVDVRFTVEADGSVSHAGVIGAEPRNVFDRSALTAVERWQFTPGTRDGNAVPMEVRQRIEFHQ
ncbi:TonB family protein [Dyella sp. LX-66]|uniref:energy transducer TonB n=1 Tax=unclassified Dyella TaxID=2634549 RepID=UPI001BE0B697|nr:MULTISPECIES: energy transducer TonB [unclassified Dyella]MBT2117731.1 TonB family protein [Dyella sp. LX-1]MBT2141246.1 TonB family protein [Dyella sp. LX-66]